MTDRPGEGGEMTVRDNPPSHRYEIERDGQVATLLYRRSPGAIELIHTEVPAPFRGQGLGGALARHALEAARSEGLGVIATCPFVRAYLGRHPEYQSLVE